MKGEGEEKEERVKEGKGEVASWLLRGWTPLIMPINCHFQDCKALLITSLTNVSSTIASI